VFVVADLPFEQNTTIRENICFGRPFDEERYWNAIRDSCLEPDLDILPYGDLTEVGERVCYAVSSICRLFLTFRSRAFHYLVARNSESTFAVPSIATPTSRYLMYVFIGFHSHYS
jgi:hypothetical protein